jgi:hypothetical protein
MLIWIFPVSHFFEIFIRMAVTSPTIYLVFGKSPATLVLSFMWFALDSWQVEAIAALEKTSTFSCVSYRFEANAPVEVKHSLQASFEFSACARASIATEACNSNYRDFAVTVSPTVPIN